MSLRIGIIGAGANTRLRHIPGFQEIDGVEVTAVCNRTRESGSKVAGEFGIATVFDDWRELLAAPDLDAICIGTWPYMHCEMTLAALEAGKHVLTEARMAMNLEEARRMQAAADASDRVTMIVPAPFYFASEPTVLRMLEAGEFGDLLEIQVSALAGSFDPGSPLTWRQQRLLSGNNIMSMGIVNETVRRYAGHERSVMAHGKTFIAERVDPATGTTAIADVPDSLGIIAEHERGAVTVYHFSNVAKGGRNSTLEFHGTKGGFRLEGGKAWLIGDDGLQELTIAPGDEYGWRVEQEFVDSIRQGAPVTHTSFADGVKYMEFTEAVSISMRDGRRVDLPLP